MDQEIPFDVLDAADQIVDGKIEDIRSYPWSSIIVIVTEAIMSERQRCVTRIRAIAEDYVPTSDREAMLALNDMRQALLSFADNQGV